MTKHILSLRYDGLDAATHHGIGTAGSKQVIGGAQILLGAHAHYYSGGKVPDRVDDRGAGFKILDVGRRQGSVIFDIALPASTTGESCATLFSTLPLDIFSCGISGTGGGSSGFTFSSCFFCASVSCRMRVNSTRVAVFTS